MGRFILVVVNPKHYPEVESLINRKVIYSKMRLEKLIKLAEEKVLSSQEYGKSRDWGNYRSTLKEAISLYRQIVNEDPDNCFHYSNLGFAYYESGEFEKALENIKTAIKLAPEDAEVKSSFYLHKGIAEHDLNQLEEAKASYTKSLEFKKNTEALRRRALVYFSEAPDYVQKDAAQSVQLLCHAIDDVCQAIEIDRRNDEESKENYGLLNKLVSSLNLMSKDKRDERLAEKVREWEQRVPKMRRELVKTYTPKEG